MTREDIDPQAVLVALGDFPDAVCTPLSGGLDARMWRVDTQDARRALRLLGASQRKQAEREQAVGRWAHAHGLPAPGVIAAGSWRDRPACLMEWADGETLAAALQSSAIPPEGAARLGQEFGVTQARIHRLSPPTDPSLVERDWRRWEETDDDLAARLDEFPDASTSLIHLDYHPFNVLVVNGEISAVLDWANAHVGDPRIDLARTLSILQLAPPVDPATTERLRRFMAGWRDGYTQISGAFDIPPLLRWWAGAAMEQDLAPRLGDPTAPWLDHAHLDRIRAWTDVAREEALRS